MGNNLLISWQKHHYNLLDRHNSRPEADMKGWWRGEPLIALWVRREQTLRILFWITPQLQRRQQQRCIALNKWKIILNHVSHGHFPQNLGNKSEIRIKTLLHLTMSGYVKVSIAYSVGCRLQFINALLKAYNCRLNGKWPFKNFFIFSMDSEPLNFPL